MNATETFLHEMNYVKGDFILIIFCASIFFF